jgi:uncharacterized protein (TIGR00369 family)
MSLFHAIGRRVPFADLLGIEVLDRGGGRARLALGSRPELHNSRADVHGGAVMTLCDIALALAAMSLDASSQGAMTIDLTVSFIGPGRGRLTAEGRCLRAGRTVAFSEGEVRDGEGALVAKAVGTFKLVRAAAGDAVAPAAPSAAGSRSRPKSKLKPRSRPQSRSRSRSG